MEIRELLEGGHADIAAHGEASKIASMIGRWMSENNQEKPLKRIMMQKSLGQDRMGFVASCKFMGLPEQYHDLMFGFGYYPYESGAQMRRDNGTDAYMAVVKSGDVRAYLVIMMVDEYPGEEFDMMYKIEWSNLIHELTHYQDRKRSQTFQKAARGTGTEYYNSPMEFNAYFQQGLYSMLGELGHFPKASKPDAIAARVATFPAFLKSYEIEFDSDWRYHMLPDTRRRFLRRLYNLWTAIKDGWPDTAGVIRAAIRED